MANKEPKGLQFPYTATLGSNIPFSSSTSAVSLFDKFFTEEVWDLLRMETTTMQPLINLINHMLGIGLLLVWMR